MLDEFLTSNRDELIGRCKHKVALRTLADHVVPEIRHASARSTVAPPRS
jgi:hypothetical protein